MKINTVEGKMESIKKYIETIEIAKENNNKNIDSLIETLF